MNKLEDIKKIALLMISIITTVVIFIKYPLSTYENISDITQTIIIKKLMMCMFIQIVFILFLQIKFKVDRFKYFAITLIILIIVYFIPLTCKWIDNVNISNNELLAQTTAGWSLIHATKTHMLEGHIFKIRYMIFLISVILVFFSISNLIMSHAKYQDVWMKYVGTAVCIIFCLIFSFNYLEQQRQRIKIEGYIVGSLSRTMGVFDDNKCGERLSKVELEELISLSKGKLSLLGKTNTDIGLKQQEMVKALEENLKKDYKWEDEYSNEVLQLMLGTVSRNYFDFLIYSQPKNYLGIYLPSNFEEKYNEWFTPQAKCIIYFAQ